MKLLSIQTLRGLAAMLVVLDHISIPITFFNEQTGGPFGHGGFGVDVFFIISGFIMVVTTAEGARNRDPLFFIRSRLARIVPLYWLVTFVVFLLGQASPASFGNSDLSISGLLSSLFFIPRGQSPLVYVGWTLNFEMLFYLIFAAGLTVNAKYRVVLVSAAILALIAAGTAFPSSAPAWRFATDPMMLEFLLGVGIGAAYLWRPAIFSPAIPWLVPTAIALSAFLAVFFFPIEVSNWRRVVQFAPLAALIVTSALFLENILTIKERSFPVLLGNASYSIYLTHFFVARVYDKLPGFDFAAKSMTAGLLCSVAILVAAALVGVAVHLLVENRLTRMFAPRRTKDTPAPTP